MVRVVAKFLRRELRELAFDLVGIFSRRQPGAVRDTEDVRIDRDGRLAKRDIQHDVGCLAADTERHQLLAIGGHLAAVLCKRF
jgi:hypothetical protein